MIFWLNWVLAALPAVALAAAPLRVRLNPAGTRATQPEPDYTLWTVNSAASSTAVFNSTTLTLSVPTGTTLGGAAYKLVFTRIVSFLGERVVGQGVTSKLTTAVPVTLTVQGLSVGNHTLLTFHNAWDRLPGATNISIAVDNATIISNQTQTVRQDSIWNSASSYIQFAVRDENQTVQITYTPQNITDLTDLRVFLNGLEFDTPNIASQASFPEPNHTDEHVAPGRGNSVRASWIPPKSVENFKYGVYFGTQSSLNLKRISKSPRTASISFPDLSTLETYYWRVDTIYDSGRVVPGRVWTFRLRQLAFPGAEGWGRFARGGRGGQVVKVTSLDDYDPAAIPIPGTLRYALSVVRGPRVVIFDIGGVITLTSRLTINDNYVTVAGQTAPGKGIAIQGWPLGLSGASDVIIRHLRVRPGKVSNKTIDGMGMQGSNHAIFDRCSMGWAIDECFSSRSAGNITLQRSMISEPLNVAGHQNYPPGTAHGYAASIGGDVGSFHHNLIAHAYGRSWSMAGGVDAAGYFAGRLDFTNNVVYNYGNRVTDGGAHEVNFVGNYYKPGPSSSVFFALKATYEDGLPGQQQYYCAGNSMPGYFKQTDAQVLKTTGTESDSQVIGPCWAKITISPPPSYQKFFDKPFFPSNVETQLSTEAYKRVLSDSGAQSPIQDAHDKRIISETLSGTTTYNGSVSGRPGIIDSEADVGGLEAFPTAVRNSTWDANGDGIADWWDMSHGGDAGWTALDGYLNFLADPHVFVDPGKQVTVDLGTLAAGFVQPCTYRVSAERGEVRVKGTSAVYSPPRTSRGIDAIELTIRDSEGSTWNRKVGVAIFKEA